MFKLLLKDNKRMVGTISEVDLKVLIDQLEEEHEKDTDYYVCTATIEMLEQNGASTDLVNLLKQAVGSSEGVEVMWQKA